MRETGIITETEKNTAKVKILKKSACGENCASCKGGCVPTERILSVKNTAGAKCGDRVLIEMRDTRVISAAFFVYILPLFIFIAGYFLFSYLGVSEMLSAIFSLIVTGVFFVLLKIYDKKNADKFMPEAVKKIG